MKLPPETEIMALLALRPSPVIRKPPMTTPTVALVTMLRIELLAPYSSASMNSLGPIRVSLRSQLTTTVKKMA